MSLPSQARAIRMSAFGEAEVNELHLVAPPQPGPGEALVRVQTAGLNYLDVYQRRGLYPGDLPCTPGVEAAGEVVAIGAGVTGLASGQRVAWAGVKGAFAEYAAIPAARLVSVPDEISSEQAAAALLQGMTAHYLMRTTHAVRPGESVLIHAAAGGTGLLLCQLARRLGAARIIGTVSTPEKAALAAEAGATDTILYTEQDFAEEVQRLTGGAGVHAVYDSVGATTFARSLKCLRTRGSMVLFGQSSGKVATVEVAELARTASFFSRPSLALHIATREELLQRAADVFRWLADGSLRLRIGATYPLAEVAQAQRDLESRRTTGKLLIRCA